jgi:peptide/nickel transport system substrate-binding protein
MRALPWILGFVLLATGIGLTAFVAGRQPGGVGVAPPPAAGGARPEGHVYTGAVEEPDDLNPFHASNQVALRLVLPLTHDTLVDSDPVTGELRLALAEQFAVAGDGMSIEVQIRADVEFADGSPLALEDVLFAWEVLRAEGASLGSVGEGLRCVRDVEVLDQEPIRLRIHLRERYFAAPRAVGESWFLAQAKWFRGELARLHAARPGTPEPLPGTRAFSELLAQVRGAGPGTGPYVIATGSDGQPAWHRGHHLQLARNERSWRRRVRPGTWNLGGFRFRFDLAGAALFSALLRGEVDWCNLPGLDAILAQNDGVRAAYHKEVYDYRSLGFFCVFWNHRVAALRDPRVRMALGHLFDRPAICRLLDGNAVPAVAFGKTSAKEYPNELAAVAFDPDRARELVHAAGYGGDGPPLRIAIKAPAGYDLFRRILDLAADAARTAGIELGVEYFEPRLLQDITDQGRFEGLLVLQGHRSWVDPYDYLHSKGGSNPGNFADAEVDDLLERARTELDGDARAALLRRCHVRLHELQPMAFLVHPRAAILFANRIRDAFTGPGGLSLERAWVPTELQRH